jgi:hypothetical protein
MTAKPILPKPIVPNSILPKPILRNSICDLVPPPALPQEDLLLILKHARSNIENGWCQHSFMKYAEDGGIQYCAVGAIRTAVDTYVGMPKKPISPAEHAEYARLAYSQALYSERATAVVCDSLRLGFRANHLARFNDTPGTTQSDVLSLFDKAIESVQS